MLIPPPTWADVDAWRAVVWCCVLGFVCVCAAQLIVPQERDNQTEENRP